MIINILVFLVFAALGAVVGSFSVYYYWSDRMADLKSTIYCLHQELQYQNSLIKRQQRQIDYFQLSFSELKKNDEIKDYNKG